MHHIQNQPTESNKVLRLGQLCCGQANKSLFHPASIGRSQHKSWTTHPSSETNLLSLRTPWLTKVICLRSRLRLYPFSGQMQWHKGGPDAPLSSCWPLPLLQSLRKGPEVEKVLGTGHIAALITHSVTIELDAPPPVGLTPSWQPGKVMGPLWLVCQQSAKTVFYAVFLGLNAPIPRHCAWWSHAGRRRWR